MVAAALIGSCMTMLSVSSSSSRRGSRPDSPSTRRRVATDVRMAKLAGREVDGHGNFGQPFLLPSGGLGAGLRQHPFPEGDDQPRLFGQGNEGSRRHEALAGMLPAHQGFGAQYAAGFQVHLGLEMEKELFFAPVPGAGRLPVRGPPESERSSRESRSAGYRPPPLWPGTWRCRRCGAGFRRLRRPVGRG